MKIEVTLVHFFISTCTMLPTKLSRSGQRQLRCAAAAPCCITPRLIQHHTIELHHFNHLQNALPHNSIHYILFSLFKEKDLYKTLKWPLWVVTLCVLLTKRYADYWPTTMYLFVPVYTSVFLPVCLKLENIR